MTQSPIYEKIYKGLGANILLIGLPELYVALKTGVADAADGPASQLVSYKMNEVQKYLDLSGHQIAVGLICINETFYKNLKDTDKKIIDKAAIEASQAGDEFSLKTENDFINQLVKSGMTIVKPDMDSIRKAAKPVIDELFKTEWDVTTWDEVNKL
jgi:TRAP-type C4-dicarboxylate transport system substrate-binding protein